tara:strand:- start:6925 stop:9249 length:2325 start_codon:yes stop_codon:yes gene_type:complete
MTIGLQYIVDSFSEVLTSGEKDIMTAFQQKIKTTMGIPTDPPTYRSTIRYQLQNNNWPGHVFFKKNHFWAGCVFFKENNYYINSVNYNMLRQIDRKQIEDTLIFLVKLYYNAILEHFIKSSKKILIININDALLETDITHSVILTILSEFLTSHRDCNVYIKTQRQTLIDKINKNKNKSLLLYKQSNIPGYTVNSVASTIPNDLCDKDLIYDSNNIFVIKYQDISSIITEIKEDEEAEVKEAEVKKAVVKEADVKKAVVEKADGKEAVMEKAVVEKAVMEKAVNIDNIIIKNIIEFMNIHVKHDTKKEMLFGVFFNWYILFEYLPDSESDKYMTYLKINTTLESINHLFNELKEDEFPKSIRDICRVLLLIDIIQYINANINNKQIQYCIIKVLAILTGINTSVVTLTIPNGLSKKQGKGITNDMVMKLGHGQGTYQVEIKKFMESDAPLTFKFHDTHSTTITFNDTEHNIDNSIVNISTAFSYIKMIVPKEQSELVDDLLENTMELINSFTESSSSDKFTLPAIKASELDNKRDNKSNNNTIKETNNYDFNLTLNRMFNDSLEEMFIQLIIWISGRERYDATKIQKKRFEESSYKIGSDEYNECNTVKCKAKYESKSLTYVRCLLLKGKIPFNLINNDNTVFIEIIYILVFDFGLQYNGKYKNNEELKNDLADSYNRIFISGTRDEFKDIIDTVKGEFETIFYYIRRYEHNIHEDKIRKFIPDKFKGNQSNKFNTLYKRCVNLKVTYANFHNMAEKNKLFKNGNIPVLPDYMN